MCGLTPNEENQMVKNPLEHLKKALAEICAECKECPHMRRLPLHRQVRELKAIVIKEEALSFEEAQHAYNCLSAVEQILFVHRI